MATRLENLARVRQYLDTPYPSRPSFAQAFQMELSVEADILNESNNSDRPWAVEMTQINYSPTNLPINITVGNFGKPILVTRVVTNNPYINRVVVPFQGYNNQLYGTVWQMWDSFAGWAWNINETPERMTFFREGVTDAQVSVTVQPQPQQAVIYEISYIPSRPDDDAPLEAQIQLPEMSELVQLRVATQLLPYAAWYENEDENRAKRKDLAAAFAYQLERKEKIFERYVSSINKPRDIFISSWNEAY